MSHSDYAPPSPCLLQVMQGSGADGIVGAIMNADSQQDMQAIIREQVWDVGSVEGGTYTGCTSGRALRE